MKISIHNILKNFLENFFKAKFYILIFFNLLDVYRL